MAVPNSRQTLKDYCLRELGFPVIEINLDDDQIDDRIDQAIDQFQHFHYDAVKKMYMKHQVTLTDITNKWIPVDAKVIGVNRIFSLSTNGVNSAATNGFNMFDINYQVRLNELYDFTSADYVYFELANQHIRTLEMLFIGEQPIRYNRYDNQLYVDVDWGGKVQAGGYLIAEVWMTLAEDTTLFWNDNWLKRYTTALLKRQLGTNLKKFAGVQLPGGIVLNGQQIYDEADNKIKELELELRDAYEMPAEFLTG